jgi:23S rRNA pseudouridine2604 synthase
MSEGVRLPELNVTTKRCKVTPADTRPGSRIFRITLTQGLNRQIRRMCEVLGYTVERLQRVRIMNIRLRALEEGQWRDLSGEELSEILARGPLRPNHPRPSRRS